jgi:dissimilatory sulfite reductase alpha subunit
MTEKTKLNANCPDVDLSTPNLDELQNGPWPSFVSGLKRLANGDHKLAKMARGVIGTLEQSYVTRKGYWKGGTVGVIGYGGGIIPRFSELKNDKGETMYPDALEFHTLRIMPPAGNHYSTDIMRKLCDVWEKHGTGLVAFHGQSGDIMFQGTSTEGVQEAFDEFNEMGFDLGGAGPAVRTGMSCVGAARCEQSCFDEERAHIALVNEFLDDMHRPALPYKFKFKVSGCPNDCMNAVQRADMATIGTWRDDIKVNQEAWKAMVADKGVKYAVDNIVSRCPTNCISLGDDTSIEIDNRNCVKCMHCINVTSPLSEKYAGIDGAPILAQGDDKGVTVLIGGKRTLKIGDLMGTVVVPFMKLESDEDYEELVDIASRTIDFFAENALEHERTGEMIERIGLVNFLEGIEMEVDPAMVNHPRSSSYVRTDGWDEEAAKWFERKKSA